MARRNEAYTSNGNHAPERLWILVFNPDGRWNFGVMSPAVPGGDGVVEITNEPDQLGVPSEAVAYAVEHPGASIAWRDEVGRVMEHADGVQPQRPL